MQQATPRQFRCAGPMLVKDNSPAHLDELRQVTTRFSNHIKYIALYKQAGVTRLIAQAHGKLSITQWRSFLGTGVHTITHNSDMRAVILEAKQQEAFEEHVSTGKTTAAGRAWVLSHVDASQEQMIHVPLLSPVPVPDHHHRQEDGGASSTAQVNNAQYVAARVIFLKALEETESQKKELPPKPPADLSLADYTPPPTSIPTMDEILTQGREGARDIYLKALEDYAGGIHHHHHQHHQCAGGGKRTWTQALQPIEER